MDKVSSGDKMWIQTLPEQGYGAKVIMAAYPQNFWKLSMVKKICKHVAQTGSATERKWSTEIRIARVEELICSKEGQRPALEHPCDCQ